MPLKPTIKLAHRLQTVLGTKEWFCKPMYNTWIRCEMIPDNPVMTSVHLFHKITRGKITFLKYQPKYQKQIQHPTDIDLITVDARQMDNLFTAYGKTNQFGMYPKPNMKICAEINIGNDTSHPKLSGTLRFNGKSNCFTN